MGLRARLSAGFACTGLSTAAGRAVCLALQKYGALLADVGSPWYLTGAVRARERACARCGRRRRCQAADSCAATNTHNLHEHPLAPTGEATPEWETWLGADMGAFVTDMRAIKGKHMEVVVPPGGRAPHAGASVRGGRSGSAAQRHGQDRVQEAEHVEGCY